MASTPSVFGDESETPKFHAAADGCGIVIGGHHNYRHAGGYWARIYISPEKPRTPGMARIKQQKIDLTAAFEQLDEFVVSVGFGYIHPLQQAHHSFAQCTAKQGMVVSDDEPILQCVTQN